MKKKELLLNGEWRLLGESEKGEAIDIVATVPGYVHPALEKEGVIPQMFFRENAELCQWPEEKEWRFVKEFELEKIDEQLTAKLCFGGIDTYADVYFNDTLVYTSSNMFIPFEAEVSHLVRVGKNSVKVVIHPYKEMIKDKPITDCAAFTSDRVYVRRVQCTFYWDWVNRFVSSGIWRDVKLVFMPKAYIEDVFVHTDYIAKNGAGVDIEISTQNALEENCRFEAEVLDPRGNLVWREQGRVFLNTVKLHACIRNPELWWPVGYGEHPLYTVDISLISAEGELLDKSSVKTGIRTVALECLRDEPASEWEERTLEMRDKIKSCASEHPGESFIILVNGERIFCTGGNWVPPTPFPGTTTRKEYENLISLAAKGNMNCIRVWGGGVYEQDLFYELCDEMGVMITQDLMLACGDYPEQDEEFMQSFKKEVEVNVKRLRNHPSIVCWSGNNENGDGYDWDDPNPRDMAIQTEICLPLFAKLDPYRAYRMSNPYGGKHNSDLTIGDNHASWWWRGAEKIDKSHFDNVGRFASESPIGGYLMPSELRKFLNEEDFLDLNSPVTEYHIKNNPYFTEVMKWPSIFGRLQRNAEVMVGLTDDAYQNVYRLCYLQYEWARLAVEGTRRSNWYGSGIQYWMYNDCWPALGFAVIDYYGRPKAGWYGTKRAAQRIASTIRNKNREFEFICLNNCLEDEKLCYKIKLFDCKANQILEIGEGEFISVANKQSTVALIKEEEVVKNENSILFFEIYKNGILLDRSRWYKEWLSNLDITKPELECSYNCTEASVTVTCKKGAAIGIALDGDFTAEDNFFDLLEGESKTVYLFADETPLDIQLYGYNLKREKIL